MQLSRPTALVSALLTLLASGCAMHSTAVEWHDRLGPDGVPVYYTSTTKVGLNFAIVLPLLGDTGITGMVDDLTDFVAEEGGDRVRIVQGSTENYWYGFPPFTWVVTPVVSTLTAEYVPSPKELGGDLEEERGDGEDEATPAEEAETAEE